MKDDYRQLQQQMAEQGDDHMSDVMNTTKKTASFIREKDIRFEKLDFNNSKKRKISRKKRNIAQKQAAMFETAQPMATTNMTFINDQSVNDSALASARERINTAEKSQRSAGGITNARASQRTQRSTTQSFGIVDIKTGQVGLMPNKPVEPQSKTSNLSRLIAKTERDRRIKQNGGVDDEMELPVILSKR